MKSLTTLRRQTAFFTFVHLLAVAPVWLMLAMANTSAYAQTSNPSPGDWTQFHRDNMQRWNPNETTLGVGNVSTIQLKWQSIFTNFAQSSPAVVNGVIYVGADNDSVYALNANTGDQLWSYYTGGDQTSSPAVANGVVYVGGGDNTLYALNASTGAKLWSYTAGDEVQSSPAVANGVVYIGSFDGNLYALNASTGAKLWVYSTGGQVASSPAVANGVVYVGSNDHNVYALNATTGAKLWSFATGDGIVFSSPAVANGMVYIGSIDHNIYALNAATGTKLWSYTTGDRVDTSPAVANGVVYVGGSDGNVYALNASTGAKLWSFAARPTPFTVAFSSPAVANGVIYVGSYGSGDFYALDASTGVPLWNMFSGAWSFQPVIVDGVLYIYSGNNSVTPDSTTGGVFAYDLAPGANLRLLAQPSPTTVHQGDLLTYAFPVWNQGPDNADQEVLNTQVPAGTTFDYIRISGTPGLGTCTTPPYQGTGQIVCHENAAMAPNTTWTVRLTVKVTAPAGTVITENAATTSDTPDPNTANNMATVSLKVQ